MPANTSYSHGQRGVAIIVVLMLLAIMVAIAGTMADRLFSQFRRATNQLNFQQAYWYSLSAESLAKTVLNQSLTADKNSVNLSQPWAQEREPFPLGDVYGTTIQGKITDQSACFNLNAFVDLDEDASQTPSLVRVFQSLLEEIEIDNNQAEQIAQSLWEYLDSNNVPNSSYGVEDSYYESLTPAYMTANTMMVDSTELRAVKGVTGEVMEKIAPYVCALPTTDMRLNINTVNPEHSALVSALFFGKLSSLAAKELLENRRNDGFSSVDDFVGEITESGLDASSKDSAKQFMDITSQYFELDAQVNLDTSRVRVRSLIFFNNQANNTSISNKETATVVRRRFGGISERVSHRSAEQE